MTNDRRTKLDIRAVARAMNVKYTTALRLVEQKELEQGDDVQIDYRNMTDDKIREIFSEQP